MPTRVDGDGLIESRDPGLLTAATMEIANGNIDVTLAARSLMQRPWLRYRRCRRALLRSCEFPAGIP